MLVKTKKPPRKSKHSQPSRAKAHGRKPRELAEMTMEAIEREWPDRWVLVQITEEIEGRPASGLVLGHGPRTGYARLARIEIARHREHPGVETFLFWTGELIPRDVYPVL